MLLEWTRCPKRLVWLQKLLLLSGQPILIYKGSHLISLQMNSSLEGQLWSLAQAPALLGRYRKPYDLKQLIRSISNPIYFTCSAVKIERANLFCGSSHGAIAAKIRNDGTRRNDHRKTALHQPPAELHHHPPQEDFLENLDQIWPNSSSIAESTRMPSLKTPEGAAKRRPPPPHHGKHPQSHISNCEFTRQTRRSGSSWLACFSIAKPRRANKQTSKPSKRDAPASLHLRGPNYDKGCTYIPIYRAQQLPKIQHEMHEVDVWVAIDERRLSANCFGLSGRAGGRPQDPVHESALKI